jgi:hypothetical protein
MNEYTILKIVVALGIGLAVGGGVMILVLVKWGRSILFQGLEGGTNCVMPPSICTDHSGIIKDVGFLATECKSIWSEIKDINLRQINLREKLPKDYVSKEDLADIKGRLKSIDEKIDAYFLRVKFEGG